jgi:hypothetical protein
MTMPRVKDAQLVVSLVQMHFEHASIIATLLFLL